MNKNGTKNRLDRLEHFILFFIFMYLFIFWTLKVQWFKNCLEKPDWISFYIPHNIVISKYYQQPLLARKMCYMQI